MLVRVYLNDKERQMDPKEKLKRVIATILLDGGARLENIINEGRGAEFVSAIDQLCLELISLRMDVLGAILDEAVVDKSCNDPNCVVHGTHARAIQEALAKPPIGSA